MKGYAVVLLLVLSMVFGQFQLSYSQCGQIHVPADEMVISSIGELGGIDSSCNEIILDEETYTLSPTVVFCTNQGSRLMPNAITLGSTVSYDYNEKKEIISVVVEVVPDENDEVFVQPTPSSRNRDVLSTPVNKRGQKNEAVRQTLHYENGVWKN